MQDHSLRQPLRLWKHVLRYMISALLPWFFLYLASQMPDHTLRQPLVPVEACSQIAVLRFVAFVFSCIFRAKCRTARYGSPCACGNMSSDI